MITGLIKTRKKGAEKKPINWMFNQSLFLMLAWRPTFAGFVDWSLKAAESSSAARKKSLAIKSQQKNWLNLKEKKKLTFFLFSNEWKNVEQKKKKHLLIA